MSCRLKNNNCYVAALRIALIETDKETPVFSLIKVFPVKTDKLLKNK